ncbi:MAG: YkgB family protein [Planctomycetales bacterium]|jgi:uncharacterized membrane protein YkgB
MQTATITQQHPSVEQNQAAHDQNALASRIEGPGIQVTRYGLALVMVWIGGMKFTAYEAAAIQPMVANSPLMSWVYELMSVRAFSTLLGVAEVAVGLMIALRPMSPKLSAVGSLATVPMFLGTLSFLFSTPGWEPSAGFPALSVVPGQFLVKDVVLLGAALLTAAEAFRAATSATRHDRSSTEPE